MNSIKFSRSAHCPGQGPREDVVVYAQRAGMAPAGLAPQWPGRMGYRIWYQTL